MTPKCEHDKQTHLCEQVTGTENPWLNKRNRCKHFTDFRCCYPAAHKNFPHHYPCGHPGSYLGSLDTEVDLVAAILMVG